MSKGVFQFDEYVLDAERLRLSHGGEVIPTHPKAVETLLVLLERRGEVVSKEELMNRLLFSVNTAYLIPSINPFSSL